VANRRTWLVEAHPETRAPIRAAADGKEPRQACNPGLADLRLARSAAIGITRTTVLSTWPSAAKSIASLPRRGAGA